MRVAEYVKRLLIPPLLALSLVQPIAAQAVRPLDKGGFVSSLGQPSRFKWSAGFGVGAYLEGSSNDFQGLFEVGVSKDLMSPVAAILAVGAEGYGGVRGGDLDGGLRALLELPLFMVAGGAD